MLALAGTNAAAVFDLCVAESGAPCLVMELLEGMDLEQFLSELEERGERLPPDRLFEIFEPVVDTLEHAHAAGILHRDLKPANVFVLSPAKGGGVRLLDFGLAFMETAAPLTALGTVLGSPSYIAPEAWSGQTRTLDRRVDVYSLAVILFRVLTGELPFKADTLHDKFVQATTAKRPQLTALRPDLPQQLDLWTARALAIDPERRFPTARAMFSALLSALDYVPRARPTSHVPESLVAAWRAAAVAFRRVITGSTTPLPAPSSPAPNSEPSEINPTRPRQDSFFDMQPEPDDLDLEKMLAEAPSAMPPAHDQPADDVARKKRSPSKRRGSG
jgi:serine/threonine-protein kinase